MAIHTEHVTLTPTTTVEARTLAVGTEIFTSRRGWRVATHVRFEGPHVVVCTDKIGGGYPDVFSLPAASTVTVKA